MKLQLIVIAVTGLATSTLNAQEVQMNQLPEPVVRTLGDVKGADTIGKIQKELKDGKTVYEVQLDRRGVNPKVWIAEDGTVIRDTRKETVATPPLGEGAPEYIPPLERTPSLRLSELPEAVQRVIQEQAAGRDIADIDRETWQGKVVYEVEFAQTGRNAQIHVAEDGTIVRHERGTTPRAEGAGTRLFGVYLGTQFEDTPPAVQETIRREAGNRKIADIDKERRTGQTIYEVEFQEPGRNIELHIAENGTIVQDSRKPGAVGAPERQPQTGFGAATREVKVSDLPQAVQDQIKSRDDLANVKRIQQTTRNGKIIYEVECEKDGKVSKLRITSEGTVLNQQ